MASNVSFQSPYYPYEKNTSGAFNGLKGAEFIPYKLLMYLLDLPDKYGYEPVDDNERPRVRLIKYLYYDDQNPLAQPLPTPEQKLSLVYNGENAQLDGDEDKKNHPKGYRIWPQIYTLPSELDARALLKCYMAREIPRNDYKTVLGVNFDLTLNYALDNITRTKAYSRMYAMHQCIVEALHGVNIAGIGTVHYNKTVHGDCGYTLYHSEGTQIYSDTFLAIEWQETTEPEVVKAF